MEEDVKEEIKNKKHIEATYKDKASNLLKICMGVLIFSGISYLIAIFINKSFDFGFIFEIIAFVFTILAINKIGQNDLASAKRDIIIAMIPIGWLIIYDLINLLVNADEVFTEVASYYISGDFLFYSIEPYLCDVTLIASIILLYRAFISLGKADGSKKADNYTDIFYDKL